MSTSYLSVVRRIEENVEFLAERVRSLKEEKYLHDNLAGLLRGVVRRRVGGNAYEEVEVDVLAGDVGIEVKVNPKFYEGVGQALAYRIYGLTPILVHFVDYTGSRYLNSLRELSRDLPINVLVIDRLERRVTFKRVIE